VDADAPFRNTIGPPTRWRLVRLIEHDKAFGSSPLAAITMLHAREERDSG